MDLLLAIIFLFILPSNILAGLFLKYQINKTIGALPTFLLSYGVAPLLNALFLYYFFWLFPDRKDFFYLLVIIGIWVVLFFISFEKGLFLRIKNSYKDIFSNIVKKVRGVSKVHFFVIALSCFVMLTSLIQSVLYPIVNHDAAVYLTQGLAVYENKNFKWREKGIVVVNNLNDYVYDSSVRPAIPFLMANAIMIGGVLNKINLIFQFLMVYYYLLLFVVFLLLIYEVSIHEVSNGFVKNSVRRSLLYGVVFFGFSWTLSRLVIFSAKETVIYFLVLSGLYLVYKINNNIKRDLKIEIVLGVILGLNGFVNLHGILTAFFTLTVLFLTSSLGLFDRFKQIGFIVVWSVLFSAFEFFVMFNFVIGNNLKMLYHYVCNLLMQHGVCENSVSLKAGSDITGGYDKLHGELYQFNGVLEMYIRGKLQIFTNIGVFGFYFWMFIIVILTQGKKIWLNKMGKVLFLFIGIYFFVVLDPFGLNRNKFAVVLWGSMKYAALILLLSMVISSVYLGVILKRWYNLLVKNYLEVNLFVFSLIVTTLFFQQKLISLMLNILLKVIPVFKHASFYREKLVFVYYIIIFSLMSGLFLGILVRRKKVLAQKALVLLVSGVFVVMPFFITNVGKVSFFGTYKYLMADQKTKLVNILFYGNIYKSYFKAKSILQKKSRIKTAFIEMYLYNDYFRFKYDNNDADYFIVYSNQYNCLKKIANVRNIIICQKNNK